MSVFDALYAYLPVWAQHGAVSAYGAYWHYLRFGPGYSEFLRGYLKREIFQLRIGCIGKADVYKMYSMARYLLLIMLKL